MTNEARPPGKYCIIGAGAAGLTTAKNFSERGIPFDCLERNPDLGGLWNMAMPGAAAHRSTSMISSKKMSRFNGFPMPANYPDFPSHSQVLAYFHSYAEAHDLDRNITLGANVEQAEPDGPGGNAWKVRVAGEPSWRNYKGVVVANGHHHKPRYPAYPGSFAGEAIHVRDYVGPEQMEGKRVLVVGGGTSGCDVAVDAAQRAVSVAHSLRRGYHVIPKYLLGQPSDALVDRFMKWPLPQSWRDRMCEALLTTLTGKPERFGMQRPKHRLFESHPTISQLYLFYVGHQRILPMPDISRFEGNTAHFANGQSQDFDLIVYATGYDISMPFLDKSCFLSAEGRSKLLLNIFNPDQANLFFVGLIQVNGGSGWPLMDQQAQMIASVITKQWPNGSREKWFDRLSRASEASKSQRFVASERHSIEVRRYEYKRTLQRLQAAID